MADPSTIISRGFSTNQNRRSKAAKIKIILDEHLKSPSDHRPLVLDIGTGNGEIAHYLGHYFYVISVDINDHHINSDNYSFLIANESLPFVDNVFDMVISNHVIEHVTNAKQHISEIYRVLKPNGWLYLATPNRLWPWEVHYRVFFAHYLPRKVFHWLMKKTGRYQEDISLLTSWQIKSLCREFPLMHSISEKVCRQPRHYQLNIPESINRILNIIPMGLFVAAHIFMPTFIFMLKKNISKKKILWLTSSYPRFENDSASVFLRNLANSLNKNNFEIHILSPDHSSIDKSFQEDSINSYHFRYFLPRNLQQLAYGSGILPNLKSNPWLFLQIPFFLIALFFSTWRLIYKIKPDLIHAHWIIPQGSIAVFLGNITGVPTVITAHGGDAFALKNPVLVKIKHWTIQHCCRWTSNTRATAKAAGRNLPKPTIIPMGIDYQKFSSGQSVLKPSDTFILLFVGRLVEKKGVSNLITAYSSLSEAMQEKTQLWIIGDGYERESLEIKIKSLKLDKQIVFFGRIANDQLPNYYTAADIFIAPSIADVSGDTEGQGVILLEAMAGGAPVISTKIGGITEIISHEKNGLLVEPNNSHELKLAMETLIKSKSLRLSLISEGKKTAKNYDLRYSANKFSALYNSLILN